MSATVNDSARPRRRWEFRTYKTGALAENGVAMNELAAFIYEACDGSNSLLEITRRVTDEYEIEAHEAIRDVRECIEDLLREDTLALDEEPYTEGRQ